MKYALDNMEEWEKRFLIKIYVKKMFGKRIAICVVFHFQIVDNYRVRFCWFVFVSMNDVLIVKHQSVVW